MIESELEGHPPHHVVVVSDNNHAVASLLFRIRSNSPSEACTIRTTMLVGAAEGPILLLKYRYSYFRALLENATSCFCGEWWRVVPTCRESLGKVCWVALKIGGFSYNHRHTRFVHN